MTTKSYFMLGSVAATTNAAAMIQIPRPGWIVALLMSGFLTLGAGASQGVWQLTLNVQVYSIANDSQGILSAVNKNWTWGTSVGWIECDFNVPLSGIAVPVVAGDRLYLHYNGSSIVTACQAILHISD
jgi:hypothetical protein